MNTDFQIDKIISLFIEANDNFIKNNYDLLDRDISERCLCANLAYEIRDLFEKYNLDGYYADVEFNRYKDDKKELEGKNIIADLIIHDRKNNNLIALEMKKSLKKKDSVLNDHHRLMKLTEEHSMYHYKLGIFYYINKNELQVTFYVNGIEYIR